MRTVAIESYLRQPGVTLADVAAMLCAELRQADPLPYDLAGAHVVAWFEATGPSDGVTVRAPARKAA